jgi:hypothetical protein
VIIKLRSLGLRGIRLEAALISLLFSMQISSVNLWVEGDGYMAIVSNNKCFTEVEKLLINVKSE